MRRWEPSAPTAASGGGRGGRRGGGVGREREGKREKGRWRRGEGARGEREGCVRCARAAREIGSRQLTDTLSRDTTNKSPVADDMQASSATD
eukprot:1956465-Rhodomonas_salina.1